MDKTTIRNRRLIVAAGLLLAPLLCFGIGTLYGVVHPNPDITLNEIGDPARVVQIGCLLIGVIAALLSLFVGLVVSKISDKERRPYRSLIGYLVPSALAVLLCLFALAAPQ